MSWDLTSERPIYTQIIEKLQMDIVSGIYKPGDKLPSVRELATEAAVNPNTMQKAMTELEHTGLVHTQRTNGRYITEDTHLIEAVRKDFASKALLVFLDNMQSLGFTKQEVLSLLQNNLMHDEEADK